MSGKFDSDYNALKTRENLNSLLSLHNLENWIISRFDNLENFDILDIGCGYGKQIFAFAEINNFKGKILGIDISGTAVDSVNNRAKDKGLSNVRAIEGNFDDCEKILENAGFDLILSTYAIYYSKNMKKLITGLRKNLNPNGQIFLSGPAAGTNREMDQFINQLSDNSSKTKVINDFLSERDISEIGTYYSGYKIDRLYNKIAFQSPKQVLEWWKNHNSFIPGLYAPIEKAFNEFFAQNKVFNLTKNVLGVHFLH